VEPSLANIRRAPSDGTPGRGCAFCAARRVDPEAAETLMRAAGLEPLGPYPGGQIPWACRCLKCGTVVRPQYANVRLGRGCINCADFGFQASEPAWIYVLRHDEALAIKVGITNQPQHRVGKHHADHGWRAVRLWSVDGTLAQRAELEIVRDWRRAGLPPAMPKGTDGYTETVSMMSVEVDDLILEVERLIRESA